MIDPRVIYHLCCSIMQHGNKGLLMIKYKEGTRVMVDVKQFDAVKNPDYNNGYCVLHHSDWLNNPERFVFHHEMITSITIY